MNKLPFHNFFLSFSFFLNHNDGLVCDAFVSMEHDGNIMDFWLYGFLFVWRFLYFCITPHLHSHIWLHVTSDKTKFYLLYKICQLGTDTIYYHVCVSLTKIWLGTYIKEEYKVLLYGCSMLHCCMWETKCGLPEYITVCSTAICAEIIIIIMIIKPCPKDFNVSPTNFFQV